MNSLYCCEEVLVVAKEAKTGPAAIPTGQLGERFPSGLRVRGRYRVASEIGAGAFGTVCLGEDESTGHRVAIRFLPRNFASTPQAAQAVLRAGRSIISASTSHQAMGRVLEFGELDTGRPFTVTEFVEGRRLSEVMMSSHTPLDVHTALRLALELGSAVETLHNMGFIHGALCPRNVMVLEDGHVKLLDIELAGLRDQREVQSLVNAEPRAEYLSPEQIQKAPISEKTDIYAYGVILYELLSGTPPFQGSTRDTIFGKHLKDAPTPIHRRRDGVPPSVARAVALALYKQPEARPLMGDILNLLWTGAHGPAPRRKRTAVIVGGAALATLAIVAVIWGALALRPPSSSFVQPTVRELLPASAPPGVETRRPLAPAIVTPTETGRPSGGESSPPSVRSPQTSVAPPVRSAPLVSSPPVDRAPLPPLPPAPIVPSPPAPVETRPETAVRQVTPPPVVSSPTPTVAPRVPGVAPAAPGVAPSAPAATPSVRPAPPPQTATPAPRTERPQTPPAATVPQQPRAPSTASDDSSAAIDWLLKPRGQ
jgi:serine/threonine protein kinase